MQWNGRAIILSDEGTAYEDLKDRLHDYYDIDDAEIAAAHEI